MALETEQRVPSLDVLLKLNLMASSCPHCGGPVSPKSVLLSASGVGRYFVCSGCRRRLSVSHGWKAVFSGALLLALVGSYVLRIMLHSRLAWFGFPVAVLALSVVLCWHARLRVVDLATRWFSIIEFGMVGLLVCVVVYAFIS